MRPLASRAPAFHNDNLAKSRRKSISAADLRRSNEGRRRPRMARGPRNSWQEDPEVLVQGTDDKNAKTRLKVCDAQSAPSARGRRSRGSVHAVCAERCWWCSGHCTTISLPCLTCPRRAASRQSIARVPIGQPAVTRPSRPQPPTSKPTLCRSATSIFNYGGENNKPHKTPL